jgi:hypothetical protein
MRVGTSLVSRNSAAANPLVFAADGGLIYLPRGVREIAAAVDVPPMAIHPLHARGGTVNG